MLDQIARDAKSIKIIIVIKIIKSKLIVYYARIKRPIVSFIIVSEGTLMYLIAFRHDFSFL